MKPSLFLVLALPLCGLPAQAELKSLHTSVELKDCARVDATSLQPPGKQEIDVYTVECPGFGGYEVIVSGMDMRYSQRSELVVVRLQGAGTCMIGVVPPGANMNVQARKLADDLSAPCLKN